MKRGRSLQPATFAEMKKREAERGKPYKRLSSRTRVDWKAKPFVVSPDSGARYSLGPRSEVVVDDGPRIVGQPIEKIGEDLDAPLLRATRRMACAFCKLRPPETLPISAHHFPAGKGRGSMGVQNDVLALPACGDGVTGCHGRAQRYEIPVEAQCVAVGETIAAHRLAGLVSEARSERALSAVPKRAIAARIREAMNAALARSSGTTGTN